MGGKLGVCLENNFIKNLKGAMWASHPTTRCRKAKFCKSVVREHSVGVDAYIDPS